MRSRDGDFSILLAICTVIFLSASIARANEYLISYRYMVKDATLYNETLNISKTMTKCDGKIQESIYLDNYGFKDLKKIINKNSDNFINYIHKLGLHVEHKEITINSQNHSTTILTLKTTCFKVDFNDNLVRMAPLK